MLILGIDTSCDETAASVLLDGGTVRSSVVASQMVHSEYGGVVPEYASREHMRAIVPVVRRALEEADVTYDDLEGIAVTNRPGLIGCLLVGTSFAKALAFALDVPVVGVDHIEGHVASVRLTEPDVSLPMVCLVASGGHTEIIRVASWNDMVTVGRTRDDASGEAFDKVGKLLGLSYPAGPTIEKLARDGDPTAFDFPRAMMSRDEQDMSFSGLKTAVRYTVEELGSVPEGQALSDLLASFQAAVVDALVTKTIRAAERWDAVSVGLGGGVAANGPLRDRLSEEARRGGFHIVVPPKNLCTDNGAVIAAVGHRLLEDGVDDGPGLTVRASRSRRTPEG
ncbi:MAG: tRNA (adenosine(37)-N6)-threonylcarbamoyltransferase complex transferase subunit TsaD [Candidatus Eisenbacteria bacterium]|nr:tRNA (adenosine(37)-N6)-threonylcarbamoyltransferase complex transferase subunit TsaD [Candidatus Eisenbacteria bacterium]